MAKIDRPTNLSCKCEWSTLKGGIKWHQFRPSLIKIFRSFTRTPLAFHISTTLFRQEAFTNAGYKVTKKWWIQRPGSESPGRTRQSTDLQDERKLCFIPRAERKTKEKYPNCLYLPNAVAKRSPEGTWTLEKCLEAFINMLLHGILLNKCWLKDRHQFQFVWYYANIQNFIGYG